MTWKPNYQLYRSWREQIAKTTESKNKIKRKNCDKFQTHQSNTDNTDDGEKSEESDRTDNGSLKNLHKLYDCKKKKNQRIQRLTVQVLRKKASLGDILLQKIQPSLSKREWIIKQRHISHEKPKITIKDVSKSESKSLELKKTQVYRDKKKWRNEKRNNSKNRIKISTNAKGFDKTDDKHKMRRKREDIPNKQKKLVEKNKHWQTYEKDKDSRSVCSFDSEIYLTDKFFNVL